MKMQSRVDSFLNRYINFSVQRNTKLKSEDLRLVEELLGEAERIRC